MKTDKDELWRAVDAGDTNRVAELIDNGANVNEQFNTSTRIRNTWRPVWYDSTLLAKATMKGDLAMMKLLLDMGADVNARIEMPTGEEVDSQFPGIKSDVTIPGTTALMLACRAPEKIKLLLSRGADVNAQDGRGHTALMWAMRQFENLESIKLLKDSGADLNIKNKDGFDAFTYAGFLRKRDVLDLLMESLLEKARAEGSKGQRVGATIGTGGVTKGAKVSKETQRKALVKTK